MNATLLNQNLEETDILKRLFDLERWGISRSDNFYSKKNEVFKEFENSTKLIDGRYQVKLPWMAHSESLHDNHRYANNRFRTLVKSFKRNLDFNCE